MLQQLIKNALQKNDYLPSAGQVACCGAGPGNVPCRRNVIRRDRIAKVQQHMGIVYRLRKLQLHGLNQNSVTSSMWEGSRV